MDAGVDVGKERGDKALPAPDGEGEFSGEEFLKIRIRAEIRSDGGFIPVVTGPTFVEVGAIDYKVAGEETVADGVAARFLFALRGFGAGGTESVAPYGGEFFGGKRHGRFSFLFNGRAVIQR